VGIRNMRSELEIPLQDRIDVRLCCAAREKRKAFETMAAAVTNLAGLKNLVLEDEYRAKPGQVSSVIGDVHIVIPVAGLSDPERFKHKIDERIQKARNEIVSKEKNLLNENFVKRAPAQIVEQERVKLTELKILLKKLEVVRNEI
jgi:valyl-tRNA synthetase